MKLNLQGSNIEKNCRESGNACPESEYTTRAIFRTRGNVNEQLKYLF